MRGQRSRLGTIVDVATLLALLVAVGLFVRRELAADGSTPPAVPQASDLMGRAVPVLEAVDSAGTAASIDVAGSARAHLLLFFRSDCPACAAQRAGWIELSQRARERGIRTLALTSEAANERANGYLSEAGVETRYMTDPSQSVDLGMVVVPATLLVDERGTIQHAAVGLIRRMSAFSNRLGAPGELNE